MNQYDEIRQRAYDANMQLPEFGLVLFTFGNASAADRKQGVFAIKPSGIPYSELTPEKMVIVDYDGKVVDGKLKPSSDAPTHAVLYKKWEAIGGIAHTHSTYATSWAQSLRDIPIYGTTHADHVPFDIPCADPMDDVMINENYEVQTGYQIINCLKNKGLTYKDTGMALVGNHGPFTWGDTAQMAVYQSAVLEELAKMALITEQVNVGVSRIKDSLIRKHFERKHGPDSYYGQK